MSDLDHLLSGSSRTFALSIPFLDEPLRSQVTTSYLLFRIADTIEDEDGWTAAERVEALCSMREALGGGEAPGRSRAIETEPVETWLHAPSRPLTHAGYARLFDEAGLVVSVLRGLDPGAVDCISGHLVRTIDGMIRFVRNGRRTDDLKEMLGYCYAVAGIVGELCTQLFVRTCPALRGVERELLAVSGRFGEGLQLVNILRDTPVDGDASRRFLPPGVSPTRLIELAREDLHAADRYVQSLVTHAAPPGVIAFNMLNVRLAHDTLSLIQEHGAGVKIHREQVRQILEQVRTESGAKAVL